MPMTSQDIVEEIDRLKDGIKRESESSSAHVDTLLIMDMARDIEFLQDSLWRKEAGYE